jgi:hypothetical protein
MAKRRNDSNARTPRRGSLAACLMVMLPGFMFVGLLAPAAVTVKPAKVEEIGPISFRNFSPRLPLAQLPVAIASAATPDIGTNAAVETVFSGARYIAEQAKRVIETNPKNAGGGEEIVLAEETGTPDVDGHVAGSLFDVTIGDPQPQLTVDLKPLWDPNLFDIIPGLRDYHGFRMWDDFQGTGPRLLKHATPSAPVPEPATGALVALGLVALGLSRKRA